MISALQNDGDSGSISLFGKLAGEGVVHSGVLFVLLTLFVVENKRLV